MANDPRIRTNSDSNSKEVFAKEEILRTSLFRSPVQDFQSHFPGPVTFAGLLEVLGPEKVYESPVTYIMMLKERGNMYFTKKDYKNALACYKEVFKGFLKNGRNSLAIEFYHQDYLAIMSAKPTMHYLLPIFLALVSCCNNIAQVYLQWQDYSNAIDWLQEVDVIYGCCKKILPESNPLYLKMVKTLEYVTYRMKAARRLVHIFSKLQNTASAAYFSFKCTIAYPCRYPPDTPEICALKDECSEQSYYHLRHPDTNVIDTWNVTEPSLQVRGIWTKVAPKSKFCPPKRLYGSNWIWKSTIYIAFGTTQKRWSKDGDAWCLNLISGKWRRLPNVPKYLLHLRSITRNVVVFEDHAWFFFGKREILRFDMVAETWDSIQTFSDFEFPYGDNVLLDAYVKLCKDKICVLGGSDDLKKFKQHIFMILDLETMKWENLIEDEWNESEMPVPRTGGMSWISSKEDKFFLMYGSANTSRITRPEPKDRLQEEKYFDLWSYSFTTRRWTRERLRGNFPCHRNDAACAYHENSDKVVVYGGGSNNIPSLSLYTKEGAIDLAYCVLGDTYVLDLKTRNWRQVITRNFPAWRSAIALLFDDDGTAFIYGGLSSREHHLGAPGEGQKIYFLSDIWKLDIDSPNSPISEQSFSKISTSFKAGCWKRCWVCKSIGTGYLRCQGSCGGKYIYCSVACQRLSWITHKRVHGCRRYQ